MSGLHWMQVCLGSIVTAASLVGCATSQNKSASLAEEIDKTQSVRTASYQAEADEKATTAKGVDDPLALKLRYAQWMEDIKNYNEAQTHYNVILNENPQEVGAILGIARIDHIAGRAAKAESGFKRALKLQPGSAVTKNALGQFYATQQRWQEAIPLLTEAMMLDSSNKVYRYHLAVTLAKSGDEQAALSPLSAGRRGRAGVLQRRDDSQAAGQLPEGGTISAHGADEEPESGRRTVRTRRSAAAGSGLRDLLQSTSDDSADSTGRTPDSAVALAGSTAATPEPAVSHPLILKSMRGCCRGFRQARGSGTNSPSVLPIVATRSWRNGASPRHVLQSIVAKPSFRSR